MTEASISVRSHLSTNDLDLDRRLCLAARGKQRRLVDKVGEIRAGKPCRGRRDFLRLQVARERRLPQMHAIIWMRPVSSDDPQQPSAVPHESVFWRAEVRWRMSSTNVTGVPLTATIMSPDWDRRAPPRLSLATLFTTTPGAPATCAS